MTDSTLLLNNPIKSLSQQDFLKLGIDQIAYVREKEINGEQTFTIHAADGTALKEMPDEDAALTAIQHNNLETVTVH